jgi:hypothetical protein
MPGGDKKSNEAFSGDSYRLIRIDTERVVNEFLAVMRRRREEAVDKYLQERRSGTATDSENPLTEADLATAMEIRMSHSTGFAHALLQGAVDAFEDQKAGLQILKRLIEMELIEMDQDASFANQATSAGSTSIN